MRTGNFQLLPVILALVLSAALVLKPPSYWSATLLLLTLSGALIAFSMWMQQKAVRSRSILIVGAFVLLAATIWLEFVLSEIETPLRWLLAFSLAWMVTPLAALGLASVAGRLSRR